MSSYWIGKTFSFKTAGYFLQLPSRSLLKPDEGYFLTGGRSQTVKILVLRGPRWKYVVALTMHTAVFFTKAAWVCPSPVTKGTEHRVMDTHPVQSDQPWHVAFWCCKKIAHCLHFLGTVLCLSKYFYRLIWEATTFIYFPWTIIF